VAIVELPDLSVVVSRGFGTKPQSTLQCHISRKVNLDSSTTLLSYYISRTFHIHDMLAYN
jgi:hypothetical protein